MKLEGLEMEIEMERKCECGKMVATLANYCPSCGAPAIRLRSENEVKAMKERMKILLQEMTGIPTDEDQHQTIATTAAMLPVLSLS